MSEVNSLADVLHIALNSTPVTLERVPVAPPRPEDTARHQLVARQRALTAVVGIFRKAAIQHTAIAVETARFNHELVQLSRSWRLRMVGDVMLCDFGNRALGGSYMAKCEAEVIAAHTAQTAAAAEVGGGLRLLIPRQYRYVPGGGLCCASHSSPEGSITANAASKGTLGQLCPPPESTGWRAHLTAANQAVFAHELFSVVQRESNSWHGGTTDATPRSFTVNLHRPAKLSVALTNAVLDSDEAAVAIPNLLSASTRPTDLGQVLALTMAMKLRRLQRAHALGGGLILREAAGFATAEQTRASAAVVVQAAAAEIRAGCVLSRLHVRWDTRSSPLSPACLLNFISRDGCRESAVHRRVVRVTIGRGSYTALDRHDSGGGVDQIWKFTTEGFRSFVQDQWQQQQLDTVKVEAENAGFVLEHRSGLSLQSGSQLELALQHPLQRLSLLVMREGGDVRITLSTTDAAIAGTHPIFSELWPGLPGKSPRHRFHAALRAVRIKKI
jgi:hypothetical protein